MRHIREARWDWLSIQDPCVMHDRVPATSSLRSATMKRPKSWAGK